MEISNSSTSYALGDFLSYTESILFPAIFIVAGLMNLSVVIGVPKVDISKSTKIIMIYQCCNNILGLGVNSIYDTLVILNRGYAEKVDVFWHKLPGSLTLGAVYSGMALLLFIAVERLAFVYFPLWSRDYFNVKVTLLCLSVCILFGFAWGFHALFDCCVFEYSLKLGKWLYSASKSSIQAQAVLITMASFSILTTVIYAAAAIKLLLIKKKKTKQLLPSLSLQISNQTGIAHNVNASSMTNGEKSELRVKQQKNEMSKEKKVFIQFAIITGVWCVYSIMFNIIQQIPSVSLAFFMLLLISSLPYYLNITFSSEYRKLLSRLNAFEWFYIPLIRWYI